MYSDMMALPTETMIAGTTKKFVLYLYTKNLSKQIDATGMAARFTLGDYVNSGKLPVITKNCSVIVPAGEELAVINVELTREDTVTLGGSKYIYQVTINDSGTVAALKGMLEIAESQDIATI